MTRKVRGSAGARLSLVTFDQGLSSASNIAALIWVAHALEPLDFGRFSLMMLVYLAAQASFRGLISTTVLVHPEDADSRPRTVLASATLLGSGLGAVVAVVGGILLLTDNALGGPTLVLGAVLPLLLLHDVGRFLAIARQRPIGAVVLDALWIVLMAGGFIATRVLDLSTLTWLVAAWGTAGAISALWVLAQYGLPGGDAVALAWIRERWSFSWRSLVSGVSSSLTGLLATVLIAVVSTPVAIAAFRAATLLAAPSTAVQLAVGVSAANDIARERDDERAMWRHVRRAILISTVVGVINLVVLVFLPDVVGELLLGQTWPVVAPLMLAISAKVLAMSAQSGCRAALIGRHRIQITMLTDILSIFLISVCMVVGAAMADAEGAVWGMAVGTAVSTVCWWVAMLWRDPAPRASGTPRAGRHKAQRSRYQSRSSA